MARLLAAACLLAASAAQARQPLHTWTDKDGVFHVDDTPPPPVRRAPRKLPHRLSERRTDAPPDAIDNAAALYKIPAELVRAVILAESGGDAAAVSRVGALGLMQLMPDTAGEMYVNDPVDPAQNVEGGTRYLRYLANQFNGDMLLTVAAYNAGPDAVRKYRGVPPFEETRQYVRKVMSYYYQLKREAGAHRLAQNEKASR